MSECAEFQKETMEYRIPGTNTPTGDPIKYRIRQLEKPELSQTFPQELLRPGAYSPEMLYDLRRRELTDIDVCCLICTDNSRSAVVLLQPDATLIYEGSRAFTGEDIRPALERFLTFRDDGRVTRLLIERNLHIATMESCTCGLIASTITDYEGASAILKGSLITYSNEAKIQAGVDPETIRRYGVYSAQTARAMAYTARKTYGSDIAVGITGTFSNTDPANRDSCAGEIYFQILDGGEHAYHMIRHDLGVTRKEMKKNVAAEVLGVVEIIVRSDLLPNL